jgi:hypothetical protein
VLRLRSLAAGSVRHKKSLPAQALNELIPNLGAVKVQFERSARTARSLLTRERLATQGGVSYVSRFLSHLILLGQTLGTESDALQHLRLSPRRLLSSLVFEAKQCTLNGLISRVRVVA